MSNESKGMLLGMLAVTGFSLTLPITRFIVPYLNPAFIGLGRAATATLFAALLLIITRQPLPNKNQFYKLLLVQQT